MEVGTLSSKRTGRRAPAWFRLPSGLAATLVSLVWLAASSPSLAQLPTAVTITPATATLSPGDEIQYQATARLEGGGTEDVTGRIEWRTTETDIARFSNDDGEEGLLQARSPGTVTVRATLDRPGDDLVATARVDVEAGEIVSIRTRPGTKRLDLGVPMQFEARAVYSNGYEVDITSRVNWASSKPKVARVVKDGPDKGRVIPRALGKATIWARDPDTGLSNSDGATEVVSPVVSLAFDVNAHRLGRGMSAFLRVYGTRGDGTRTNVTDDVQYVATPPGIVEVDSTGDDAGKVTALKRGVATIRAIDPERNVVTGDDAAATVVVRGKLKRLRIDPQPIRLGTGDSRRVRVFGVLTGGLETNDLRTAMDWSVDDPTVATVETEGNEIGTVAGLTPGTTTLRARDPASGITTAVTDNLVVRGQVTSVTIEPGSSVVARDIPFPLRAYANRDDGSRSNITSSAEWSIEPPGLASVEEGLVAATADGTATVTARDPKTGFSGTASVRVAGTAVSLSVQPIPFRVDEGDTRKARAIARLSSGTDSSDLRAVVDWAVDNTNVARVGTGEEVPEGEEPEEPVLERGEVLGLDPGTTTLHAIEPLTGLESRQTGNLIVGEEGGGPGPNPTPRPSPRPTARPGGGENIASVAMEGSGQLTLNESRSFKVRATLRDGSKNNISDECRWRVDDPSVAAIEAFSSSVLVTGLKLDGTTTLRATCYSFEATVGLTVNGRVVELVVDPTESEGPPNSSFQLAVTARYQDGATADYRDRVLWTSTDSNVATVDNVSAKGTVTLVAAGEALIVATDSSGHSAFCLVRVVETPAGFRIERP